jgi:hypothetical protein
MKSKCYSGIGSRKSPPEVLALMTEIAGYLKRQGYWLRTGAADGADLAFGHGLGAGSRVIYYLPWKNYNMARIPLPCKIGCNEPTDEAIAIAKTLHPNPAACSESVWKLHGRNCHIVSGVKLDSPSEFVILWTPKGERVGGTAMAWAYAEKLGIPVLNLANLDTLSIDYVIDWLNST